MVLCNKIAEGIDTRNIGESVLLSLGSRCIEFFIRPDFFPKFT
ncbi:hypothetical protein LEP1GSC026_2903 [Leptospira interrogans str. 2002000623]|uniref:Uncharacterized protein n=2 Tax=Leptospira interrogans TaxID=173 RepID=A0A829D8H1_LEPIR|nr:hypothetical protein LEP1GSC027_3406 [Leptospira interrogans str. 2002000624]EKQ38453.1 hypothetical protein LEP1GSC025_3625 [Leptospira interrogans str. 2002000621]EKQ48758.1 hypothetical protein LEP1GSC026_2903 [Leptospira interrogans str. 2002000623]EMY05420.1 hypothetical protein LEP1GSC029_2368 [Leptospira interrogans str. 2002000626]EMY26429.1 hypothetical protein LEP1GSC115_5421 [Leptospira interrogans serovar Australis str. 200703203]